jgi:hypothetical protein
MLSRYTYGHFPIHCCKFKFSFASFLEFLIDRVKLITHFSVLLRLVEGQNKFAAANYKSMMEKRNGFIEKPKPTSKIGGMCSNENVGTDRSEKLESNIAFIGAHFCNNIPFET